MKQSKKQDVAIAKLNMAIGDIANQLIKNNIKLPRKNPRYANKLGKKPMRGGGDIDSETINSIKQFLDDNKDTVIQLKNKLILDILELYKYIVGKNSNDVDYEIVGTFYIICITLLDNNKIIYDNTFDKLYSPSEAIVNDIKYKKDLANIDNTKYILKLINIYYLIFINNNKDTISFENNTINLDELFNGTLFEQYNAKSQHPKNTFVKQCDNFIRIFKANNQVYSGNTINDNTIAFIIPFLEGNKNTVIQLKIKLILDIYDYIIKCCSNDPDEKNSADIYMKIIYISRILFDNTKGIYDYSLNNDIYKAKELELGKYENKKIKENDINNTIYILQFINIYYTIFDKNKKRADTYTFGNNTINLDELFKGTLFEENSDIEKNKKKFVGAYDTFKRRIEGDEKIVVENKADAGAASAAAQPIVSTAEEIKEELNQKIKKYFNHNLNYLNFLTVKNKNKKQNEEIIKDIENNLKDDDTYKNLKIEEKAIDKILEYKVRGRTQYPTIIEDSVESTKLIKRIDTYITNVKNFAPVLQNLYDNYYDAITKKGGRNPPPKYKSTGRIVHIMYKKRNYKRTVYVKGKRNTKYCKIDGEYILLSKMKVIEGH